MNEYENCFQRIRLGDDLITRRMDLRLSGKVFTELRFFRTLLFPVSLVRRKFHAVGNVLAKWRLACTCSAATYNTIVYGYIMENWKVARVRNIKAKCVILCALLIYKLELDLDVYVGFIFLLTRTECKYFLVLVLSSLNFQLNARALFSVCSDVSLFLSVLPPTTQTN